MSVSDPGQSDSKKTRAQTASPKSYVVASAVMIMATALFGVAAWLLPKSVADDVAGILCGVFLVLSGAAILMALAAAFGADTDDAKAPRESIDQTGPGSNRPQAPTSRPRKAA